MPAYPEIPAPPPRSLSRPLFSAPLSRPALLSFPFLPSPRPCSCLPFPLLPLPRPPPFLLLLLFLHPNATYPQRVLLAERRRRRSVAMFVQAHAFVLAEGDGQRPLCMVPRAQRPLSQVLKMPRSLVLQPGLSAVPLGSRTSRGVLGHPVRACLRPTSEGIEGEGPGLCRGTAEGKVGGGGEGCRSRRDSRTAGQAWLGMGGERPRSTSRF